MSRERANERFRVAFIICVVLGLIESAWIVTVTGQFKGGGAGIVVGVLLWISLGPILGALQLFPYAFFVLGIAKIREQRREGVEALGNENKVHADADGERKLHDYLTAMTSTEARIGLLGRSAPWIPPEQRLPEGSKPLLTKFSTTGRLLVALAMLAGAAGGCLLGVNHGLSLDVKESEDLVLLIAAALFGMVLASPFGIILAVMFGRVEQRDDDDPGTGDRQAA